MLTFWGVLQGHLKDPLYRNSYLIYANTILITSSGLLFWFIAARLTDPETLGLASSIISSIMLMSLLAGLGSNVALLRFLPGRHGPEARDFLNTTYTITAISSLIAGVVFAVGTPRWAPALGELLTHPGSALVFAIFVAVWTIGGLFDATLTARRSPRFTLAKNAVFTVVRLVTILLVATAFGSVGIVMAWFLAMAVGVGVAAVRWLPHVEPGYFPQPRIKLAILRKTLPSSFANYWVSILFALPLAVGSLVVLNREGAAAAGKFYVIWMLGSLALAIPAAFGQSALVEMTHRKSRLRIPIRGLVIATIAGVGTVVVGLICLPWFGGHYADLSFWSLLPFGLAAVPGFVLNAQLAVFRSENRDIGQVVAPLLVIVSFFAGLLATRDATQSAGWIWLISLSIGAIASSIMAGVGRRKESRNASADSAKNSAGRSGDMPEFREPHHHGFD